MTLEGIKVLDLSRVLAGPYCTMLLADLGAEVVKVEMPDVGDDARAFGPFLGTESAYFMSINRNKQSITLNLKLPEAQDIFRQMIGQYDILVENFRPGDDGEARARLRCLATDKPAADLCRHFGLWSFGALHA